jgi:DNA end-binding protein Ku
MNFADEIVSVDQLDELSGQELELSDREREIAHQLVDSLSAAFAPAKYKDTYREAVLELIERKANGEEIVEQPATAPRAAAPDLMSALQASLDEARKRKDKPAKRASRPKAQSAKGKPRTPAKARTSKS